MKILLNLFIIYFLVSNFSYSDHHAQNEQKHEENHTVKFDRGNGCVRITYE